MKNGRKGMTLFILVVYIVILGILTGAVIITFYNNNEIQDTSEEIFKSRISDYIKEYEVNKNYNIVRGVDLTELTIDDLIPTITVSDKKILKLIQVDGLIQLVFYGMDSTDVRYKYLMDLGLNYGGI